VPSSRRISASLTCLIPLIITDRISRLVVTGYDTGEDALGLIKTRRALDTVDGALKTNSEASNIKPYPSIQSANDTLLNC